MTFGNLGPCTVTILGYWLNIEDDFVSVGIQRDWRAVIVRECDCDRVRAAGVVTADGSDVLNTLQQAALDYELVPLHLEFDGRSVLGEFYVKVDNLEMPLSDKGDFVQEYTVEVWTAGAWLEALLDTEAPPVGTDRRRSCKEIGG